MSISVCQAIRERPYDWRQTEHTFLHVPSGYEIWTANIPLFNAQPYPGPSIWTLRDRWRFVRTLRWWSRNKPVEIRKPANAKT